MPTRTFSGSSTARKLNEMFRAANFATPGFPFTNGAGVTESVNMLLNREPGIIEISPQSEEDFLKRPNTTGWDASIKFSFLETPWTYFVNMLKLSRVYCQASVNAGGVFYNFTENTGGAASPNGSCLLGLMPKLSLEDNKNRMDVEAKGRMWKYEADYLFSNTDAAETGGSGGTALTQTAQASSRSNQFQPGLAGMTIGTYDVGIRKSFKLDLEAVDRSGPDNKERVLPSWLSVKCEVNGLQLAAIELLGGFDATYIEQATVLTLASGKTVTFDAGSMGVKFSPTAGEGGNLWKMEISGESPYPTDWAFPDSFDIQANSMTFHKVGTV